MTGDIYFVVFSVLLLLAAAVGFVYLFALSIFVHDTSIITGNFVYFFVETLLVAILPALPFFFFVVSRGISIEKAKLYFYSLAAKFGVFHLLLQLSGYYRYLFAGG